MGWGVFDLAARERTHPRRFSRHYEESAHMFTLVSKRCDMIGAPLPCKNEAVLDNAIQAPEGTEVNAVVTMVCSMTSSVVTVRQHYPVYLHLANNTPLPLLKTTRNNSLESSLEGSNNNGSVR